MSGDPKSDEALAIEAQNGSLSAFEELVFRYEKRIYRFVRNSCGHDADAVELTQDTFVKAYQALAQYDRNYVFAAWLFTIARRKCVDRYRQRPPIPEPEFVPQPSPSPDPSETLSNAEERENLWKRARRLLPDAQFQALWLRYAEDMDIPQIAQVLRKTRTHVKVLLYRARSALAVHLRAASGEPKGSSSVALVTESGGTRPRNPKLILQNAMPRL